MNKLTQALKSRGNWTVFFLLLFNVLEEYYDLLPLKYQTIANILLTLCTIYFKVFPSQDYK